MLPLWVVQTASRGRTAPFSFRDQGYDIATWRKWLIRSIAHHNVKKLLNPPRTELGQPSNVKTSELKSKQREVKPLDLHLVGQLSGICVNSHTPARSLPEPVWENAAAAMLHLRTGFLNPSAPGPALLHSQMTSTSALFKCLHKLISKSTRHFCTWLYFVKDFPSTLDESFLHILPC